MAVALPETPTVGLGTFIEQNKFLVPSHQRDYSWDKSCCEQFLKDIENSMTKNDQIYFCGLMVFTKPDDNTLKVLDGQQRLATALMLFSAIRNWFRANKEAKLESQTEQKFLSNDDFGEEILDQKLRLNPANNDIFKKYVIDPSHFSDIATAVKDHKNDDRNNALMLAVGHISKFVSDKASSFNSNEAKNYFVRLVKYLEKTVQIVRFIVSGDDAAYTIFETLNDRCLDLAPLDLVKNFLFSRAERHHVGGLRDLEERWSQMMTILGPAKPDSFLRAFWTSRTGNTDGSTLFKEFKDANDDPLKAYQIGIDMRDAAERYIAIFRANDPVWSRLEERYKDSVEALSIIDPTQMYPVIIAAAPQFTPQEMGRLLRLLEVLAVRHQLVGKRRPGRIESLCSKAALMITERKITTASHVKNIIDELYVPDEVFKRDFLHKTERDSMKARYLLTRLERQSLLKKGETYDGELVPGAVTLEHIYPKTPKAGWITETEADPKLKKDCLYRLGNLCLLTGVNRDLGNRQFSEKKEAYSKSRIRITSEVSQFQHWGRKEISKRQEWMADLAVAEWRFQ